MYRSLLVWLAALWLPSLIAAQLTGRVGPTTSLAQKRAKKTCDITKYGAKPGKGGDIGPALQEAFNACKTGGNIVIPPGEWGLGTWVAFKGGSGWSLQWDGAIHRSKRGNGGNMLLVTGANDVEFWSSNGKGAFQGNGYEYHRQGDIKGPRILRFVKTQNFAVHDLAFADSPSFHFSMDTCKNGEVYNMAIRGAYQGGLDGIDVWANNMWIHDIMVTNKDECVDIKNPAHNILVENIYCNWSGGSAFGSLGVGVDISNVVYRNIYTVHSNQQMMFKSWGGEGQVSNVLLENFIGYSNAYTFNIDQKWQSMKQNPGPGVKLSNITAKNWQGTCEDGNNRPPIKIVCSDSAPCKNIRLANFNVWTEKGNSVSHLCQSAYGSGACLKSGSGGAYPAVKQAVTKAPSSYKAARMPWDLKENPGTKKPIAIPQIPDYFFPGTKPIKPLARKGAGPAPVAAVGPAPGKSDDEPDDAERTVDVWDIPLGFEGSEDPETILEPPLARRQVEESPRVSPNMTVVASPPPLQEASAKDASTAPLPVKGGKGRGSGSPPP